MKMSVISQGYPHSKKDDDEHEVKFRKYESILF